MSTTSPRSSEGGIFARLRRGRSKMSMKDDDETSSRLSDAERSFINHTPTKSPSKAPSKGPALSLPLSFANASQTNLREDTGISQYLSSNQDPSPITPKNESLLPREEPLAPKPATPRKSTAAEVPTASRGSALDVPRPETGRSAANSHDNSWQSRVVIEMKEKEQLIGRFEALSRVHMALQDEVEKERIRADSAEAAARKRDPSFGKRTPNGDTSLTNGTVAGAAAGPTLSKEDEDKAAKQREQLQQQRSEFERQKEEFRQAKADIDRERTIMQTQRAELERQKEAHASSLADHEQSRSAQASAHSEQASRDRELHGTQLSDLRTRLSTAQSDHAKDREAHAAEISNLNAQLNRDRDHHVSNTSDLHNQLATAETSTTSLNNELSRLRTHNDQLKTQISKSTLSPAQTTDDEFVTQLSSLQSDVRLWVTNNFSRSRIDFEKLEKQGDSKELKQIRSAVPQYKKAAEQSKIDFLQALVSAQLMDKVWDDDFYVAMPAWEEEHETKDEGRGGLTYLREPFKVISAYNTPESHAWRASTVSILRRCHDPGLTALTNKLISRIAFSINNLLSSITAASGSVGSSPQGSSPLPSRVRDLQAFIAKSIDLARLFRAQRAVFHFSLPGSVESTDGLARVTTFDGSAMDDVLDKGAEGGEKTVLAASWPLVVKIGGEGLPKDERSLIFKAKVFCDAKEA